MLDNSTKWLEQIRLILQVAILFMAFLALIQGRVERVKTANERMMILNLVAEANPHNEAIQAAYRAETGEECTETGCPSE